MTQALQRFSGLAAVAVLWSTLGAAVALSGFPLLGRRPLSWLASDPASSVLFATGLAGAALLFIAFHGHVRRRYPVGRGFSLAMLAGQAGQLVSAVVPIHGGGVATRVHTVAALVLGASLPVLMALFTVAQVPGPWRRRARRLFWAEAAACAVGVALSRRSVAPLAEILPAACFHAWVVVLTLSGPAQRRGEPSPGVHDAPLGRPTGELVTGRQLELAQHRRHVALDGLHGARPAAGELVGAGLVLVLGARDRH